MFRKLESRVIHRFIFQIFSQISHTSNIFADIPSPIFNLLIILLIINISRDVNKSIIFFNTTNFDTCIFQFPFRLPTEYSRFMAQSIHGYLVVLEYFCRLSVGSMSSYMFQC